MEDFKRYRLHHRTRPLDVWVAGDGPPLLFLHGWALSGRTYRSAILALANLGWKVAAPSIMVAEHWSVEAAAEIAAEAMAGVDAAPAPVVGHSLGGAIGARLALEHPDFVSALVPVSSPLVTLGGRRVGRIVLPGPHYRAAVHLSAATALFSSATSPAGLPSLLRSARWFLGMGQEHTLEALAQTDLPRAILWTENDQVVPITVGVRSAELLQCELLMVRADEKWPGKRPPDHDWPISHAGHFAETVHTVVTRLLGKNVKRTRTRDDRAG